MRLMVHKLSVLPVPETISLSVDALLTPACGDYIWTLGSKKWRHVTCKKCRLHKPKRDRRQGRLF